ncbi:MAG: hypothetical protein ACYC0M_07795 [Burkholderiales bacterium]
MPGAAFDYLADGKQGIGNVYIPGWIYRPTLTKADRQGTIEVLCMMQEHDNKITFIIYNITILALTIQEKFKISKGTT